MSDRRADAGPGWSMGLLGAVMVVGVLAGAAIGVGTLLTGIAIGGWSSFAPYLITGAVAVGATVGALAGFGALVALVIVDHWGTKSRRFRALGAAGGSAVAVGAASTILVLSGWGADAAGTGPWIGPLLILTAVSAALAGGGLALAEWRWSLRPNN